MDRREMEMANGRFSLLDKMIIEHGNKFFYLEISLYTSSLIDMDLTAYSN